MAITATVLNNIRATYPSRLDVYENRITSTGALTAVEEMNNSSNSIITQEIKKLAENSQGRQIEVPVMIDGDVTLSNTRTCVVGGVENDSALVNVTWQTVVLDITMTPGQYPINSIQYNQDLAMKIRRGVNAINRQLESNVMTAMDNAKSQVYNAASLVAATGAKYGLTGSAIRVASAQQELFFNDVDAIQLKDDLEADTYKVIASAEMMPTIRLWANQGAANQNNRSFQFEDGRAYSTGNYDFSFSNGVNNGTGVRSTAYLVPDGAVGFMTRLDFDAKNKSKATKGTEWSVERLPGLSFPVGLKYDSDCADQSTIAGASTGHLTATLQEKWQFSFDYAILTPYNSDITTRPNPIRKIEFL
ncbi:MAG: hypothetical protein ACPGRW_06365 [Flavobacteriaceae bacterium]